MRVEPVSYAAVEEDYTIGLVIEVFDDSDKVCADVVFLHGCPKSCMPNPVKGLLEVYEDIVEVLLVLKIFLTSNAFEDLLCGTPSCSEACLFFGDDLLRLWLQSVRCDLQRDFAWVTVVAYCLQVSFLGKCDD